MSEIISNKRIAKNTMFLYLRTLIVIVINLYASRVILVTLGVVDYGIYNVVAGVVAMFGFLNNAMVAASQRFIAFEQGRSDLRRQKEVYSTSILIHVTIALVILFFAETIGLWFLNNKMTIDSDRMTAANWVYQSAILSFLIKIINTPSRASVVAHERMQVFAIISILDAFLQLAIIYLLKVFAMDKLILYSILLLIIALINQILYKSYTLLNFKECRFVWTRNFVLYKEMLGFAGWSFVGNLGIALRGPGVNIVVNMFCGPAVNAARGIAYQVSSVISNFVSNFQTAVTPQITKRYAAGEVSSMSFLIRTSAKFSFFLLAIVVVPLFVRADYVLNLWLEEVPELTLQFLRGVLLVALIHSMSGPFASGIQATGKIKTFQIAVAIIMLIDLPLSWLILKAGFPPYSVMYVAVATELIALVARMVLLEKQVTIDLKELLLKVLLHNILTGVLLFVLPVVIDGMIPQTFGGVLLLSACSVLWSLLIIYVVGMTKNERDMMIGIIRKRINKDK